MYPLYMNFTVDTSNLYLLPQSAIVSVNGVHLEYSSKYKIGTNQPDRQHRKVISCGIVNRWQYYNNMTWSRMTYCLRKQDESWGRKQTPLARCARETTSGAKSLGGRFERAYDRAETQHYTEWFIKRRYLHMFILPIFFQ